MPLTPEDILGLDTPQSGSLDDYLGRMGTDFNRNFRDRLTFLTQLASLGNDPGYAPSIKSWQTKLEKENTLHYFPTVVNNLYAAQIGRPGPPDAGSLSDMLESLDRVDERGD